MSTELEDCHFFLTSGCMFGRDCPYRHSESARKTSAVCHFWLKDACNRVDCKFRHPTKKPTTYCHFEETMGGCQNRSCTFLHKKSQAKAFVASSHKEISLGSSYGSICIPISSRPLLTNNVAACSPGMSPTVQSKGISLAEDHFGGASAIKMSTQLEDCYFFLTSNCMYGNGCQYRHCKSALKTDTTCSLWMKDACSNVNCEFRHPTIKPTTYCHFEEKPGGCQNQSCTFLHKKSQAKAFFASSDKEISSPDRATSTRPSLSQSPRQLLNQNNVALPYQRPRMFPAVEPVIIPLSQANIKGKSARELPSTMLSPFVRKEPSKVTEMSRGQDKDSHRNNKYPGYFQRQQFSRQRSRSSQSEDVSASQKTTAQANRKSRAKVQSEKKFIRNKYFKKHTQNVKTPQQPEKSLLSFSRVQSTPASYFDEVGEDDETTSSRCSSPGLSEASVGDLSDQESSESDSFSAVSCPYSETTEIAPDYVTEAPKRSLSQQEETYVSVFWDIENCRVPKNISAVDVVHKVRNTLYRGRTEKSFTVICDVLKNLNKMTDRELSECHVKVMHANSETKNAADTKLQKEMFDFQYEFRSKGAGMILISGDSDFSTFLYDMRYKHNIEVTLICDAQARETLRKSAQYCILFDDFISDLPSRSDEGVEFYVILSGLPSYAKDEAITTLLIEQIRATNAKITEMTGSTARIMCPNQTTATKIKSVLHGFDMYGSKVVAEIQNVLKKPKQNKKRIKSKVVMPMLEQSKGDPLKQKAPKQSSPKLHASVSSEKEPKGTVDSKPATMYIFVTFNAGNVNFWEREFIKLFRHNEFSVRWHSLEFDGYFLVKFDNFKKAQKARRRLEIEQQINPNAPKFIKLIKEDSVVDALLDSVAQIVANNVGMKIHSIEKKKDMYLKLFEEERTTLKQLKSMDPITALNNENKLTEMTEYKTAFLSFTGNAIGKLKGLTATPENVNELTDDILRDYIQECNCFNSRLPIYLKKTLVVKKVRTHQVVVIQAETGSGKTTQLCQYLWREGFAKTGMIVCTQPRKIAAVSIAKHVSSQVGCSIGGIVGYQVGVNKKCSERTKILYATDFTVLKMCAEDPLLRHVSCIVVDEAHERNIYTDLFLGMVKRAIRQRPDLKVVITSATLNINIFQSFFNLPLDAVLQVPGRTYPIEDIWLGETVHVGWDYLSKSVETSFALLKEERGDILVFLPTPLETEKAAEKFKTMITQHQLQGQILVYYLHGKLDVQEQQKIFERTAANARKVVFSTNCAETSVTIPGIRYVVDSGMVKEASYDPVRNMNVLAVTFVSKSSAEQRRGRAGRTESGKCYRLYSRENYGQMADHMIPEILRVNLGQALLKLLLLGVTDILKFEYVESPPQEALSTAMRQLVHLGAVSDLNHKLTYLGTQMAALPLEPRLCHLILKGIEREIGYESVVVAALATVARNIFFRNSENKDVADLKKVRFCQPESDFLTYLEIYKEWSDVPKAAKSRWCVLNCINGRSMRLAHELVTELITNCSKELQLNVSRKFASAEKMHSEIHRTIFESFSENLCIFSGLDSLGYFSLSVPGSLYIHPSSSLCSLGSYRPRYIVYDTILKTSQVFLLNITTVSDIILQNTPDYVSCVDIGRLESLSVVPYVFDSLGVCTLKSIIGAKGSKVKALEKTLEEISDNSVCKIRADFERGRLSVFVPSQLCEIVMFLVSPIVEEVRRGWCREDRVVLEYFGTSSLSFVVGMGAKVCDVILPGEYRDVKVTPASCDVNLVREKLEIFGEIVSIRHTKKHQNVVFRSVANATNAVQSMMSNSDGLEVLPGRSYTSSDSASFFKILVSLTRRPCTGYAFMSISPVTNLPLFTFKFFNSRFGYKSRVLLPSISKKCETDIFLKNLPENVNNAELMAAITQYLPEETTISKLAIVRKKAFSSNVHEIEAVRNRIENLFKEFTSRDKFHVDLASPKTTDIYWKAIVYFDNPHDGQNAATVLKMNTSSRYSDSLQDVVMLKPVLETSLYCSKEIYEAIKPQIEEALEFFNRGSHINNQLQITVKPTLDQKRVYIWISSNNVVDFVDARKSLQRFIQGDQIDCSINNSMQAFFNKEGKRFLKQLCQNSNCHVSLNENSKMLHIFGTDSTCTMVKSFLNTYLDDFEKKGRVKLISLKSPTSRLSALKEVIKQYEVDLEKLCTLSGCTSAKINVRTHEISVRGSEHSITQCESVICDIIAELDTNLKNKEEDDEDKENCPVCLCKVTMPQYRLEYCGHAYCDVCFLSQLHSVDDMPIRCCTEGCTELLVIQDLLWAVKKDIRLEKKIFSKAFDSFMKESDAVKYCPTPDCTMVYRATQNEKDARITCSKCLNDICAKCGVLYHTAMSCDIYKSFKSEDDVTFARWMFADRENRKRCPSCKAPIEKNGGCTHMTCWKCQCHMCWLCLKVFPTGTDVYNHQSVCTAR